MDTHTQKWAHIRCLIIFFSHFLKNYPSNVTQKNNFVSAFVSFFTPSIWWAEWYTPVISALGRQNQEAHLAWDFKTSLANMARTHF
jgi:hypothetical protein